MKTKGRLSGKNKTARMERANTHRVYAIALEGLNRNSEAIAYWNKAKQVYQEFEIREGADECESHLKSLRPIS